MFSIAKTPPRRDVPILCSTTSAFAKYRPGTEIEVVMLIVWLGHYLYQEAAN